MFLCRLCAFLTELDDAVVVTATGRCICLRCFLRETGGSMPMDPRLYRELTALLTTSVGE